MLTNEGTRASQSTVTARDGTYLFAPVEIGTYTVEVEVPAFQKECRPHIVADRARHFVVDFSLVPGAVAQNGHVTLAPSPRQGRTSAGELGHSKDLSDRDQLLSHFDYYDRPQFKPGQFKDSADAGGYSAPAYADSYDLILAYVENERAPEANFRDQCQVLNESGGGPDHPDARASGKLGNPGGVSESPRQSGGAAPSDLSESEFFARGSDLLLRRQFGPAVEIFSRGVERYTSSAKLQIGLGIALYARGQYDDAVKALSRATDLVPSDPRPYLFLAKAYNVSSSQADEVTYRLQRFVQIEPQNALAQYYYALSLWKGKRSRWANLSQIEELLKRAVTLDPRFPDAHFQLGILYADQTKYPDAIQEYQQAVKLKPDFAEAHYRLGQSYMRTGEKARAQREFEVYDRLHREQSRGRN